MKKKCHKCYFLVSVACLLQIDFLKSWFKHVKLTNVHVAYLPLCHFEIYFEFFTFSSFLPTLALPGGVPLSQNVRLPAPDPDSTPADLPGPTAALPGGHEGPATERTQQQRGVGVSRVCNQVRNGEFLESVIRWGMGISGVIGWGMGISAVIRGGRGNSGVIGGGRGMSGV